MEWTPFETPPPANRIVLMFAVTDRAEDGKVRNWRMGTGVRYERPDQIEWEGRHLKEYDHKPTHWQFLPLPPIS